LEPSGAVLPCDAGPARCPSKRASRLPRTGPKQASYPAQTIPNSTCYTSAPRRAPDADVRRAGCGGLRIACRGAWRRGPLERAGSTGGEPPVDGESEDEARWMDGASRAPDERWRGDLRQGLRTTLTQSSSFLLKIS